MKRNSLYLSSIVAIAMIMLASPALAQTPVTPGTPLVAGDKLAVDLPDNVTLTDAPTWTYRVRDGAVTVTEVTGLTCQASTTANVPGTCLVVFNQSHVDALNMAGLHSITASMFKAGLPESPSSLPLSWPSKAGAPRNLRLTK